jgi:hypothetical protein
LEADHEASAGSLQSLQAIKARSWRKLFPEIKDHHLTEWAFRNDVEGRELSKYGATIELVEKVGHGTLQAMDIFSELI